MAKKTKRTVKTRKTQKRTKLKTKPKKAAKPKLSRKVLDAVKKYLTRVKEVKSPSEPTPFVLSQRDEDYVKFMEEQLDKAGNRTGYGGFPTRTAKGVEIKTFTSTVEARELIKQVRSGELKLA